MPSIPRSFAMLSVRSLGCGLLVAAVLQPLAAPSFAHDAVDTPLHEIVSRTDYAVPTGPNDDDFNGFKVFLSSPRHSNSGNRGECSNPGRQENVNGRDWGVWAMDTNWYGETLDDTNHYRNIHSRGYKVALSQNTKDDGFLENVTMSKNYGSDVHIVTHTNADRGCDSDASYLLTQWEHSNDDNLAREIGSEVNWVAPDGWNHWQVTYLAELERNAPRGDAYVELQFHDNQRTQRWIYEKQKISAYRYGLGIDAHLGYPS